MTNKTLTETNLWVALYCGAAIKWHIIKYEREHTGLVRIRSSKIKISHLHNLTYFITQLSYTQNLL